MDPELIGELVHDRTNLTRQSYDLSTLARDPALEAVARYHSRRMADVGRLFHEAPDGETLSDRLEKMAYDTASKATGQAYCHNCGADLRPFAAPSFCPDCGAELQSHDRQAALNGENLAYVGFTAPQSELPSEDEIAESVVDGWLDSPGHRENLLEERFEREAIGVAITEETGTRVYVTQHFS